RLIDGDSLGTLQEAYAALLKPGDRFVLSGRCVRFVGVQKMTVLVVESENPQPTVPRWGGQMLAMGPGLSAHMRDFRAKIKAIAPAGPAAIARMLTRQYGAAAPAASLAAAFLHAQHRYAEIPTAASLLIERVPDEDSVALIFHAMHGRAVHDALARLVAWRLGRCFGAACSAASVVVDDYAFGIWVPQRSSASILRADRTLVRTLLSPDHFSEDLLSAIETSELFKTQFRFTAQRSQAIVQNRFGRRSFIGQLQNYSTRLYEALQQTDPNHPLIRETRRTILEDLLQAPAAHAWLQQSRHLPLDLIDLDTPSPFSFGLFATCRRDTLHFADSADFLLAMYQKVQARLKVQDQSAPPAIAQASLF
ncbi:MAG: hypothetical protein WCI73_12550, partial [Phycisphaerae bacterium]